MLLLVSSIKLIAEIALMALLGQWLLGLLAGSKRENNLFYQLLSALTKPFLVVARRVSPRQVLDRHLPLVAASLLGFVWLGALVAKVRVCLAVGMVGCR